METWPDAAYSPFRCAKGSTWEGGQRVPGDPRLAGHDRARPRLATGCSRRWTCFRPLLALAGAAAASPEDRFIDGVDQTSFLLSRDGASNRKHVYYWLGRQFSALRVGEYKFMLASISDDDRDVHNPGGFTGVSPEVPLRPPVQPLPRPQGDAQLPDPQARVPGGVPERRQEPPDDLQEVPAEGGGRAVSEENGT